MRIIIFGFGIVTNVFLIGLFLWFLQKGVAIREVRTMVFAALAVDSLFYAFACKNLRKNIWQYNPFSNFYLIASIIFSVAMLLAAIYLSIFQELLKTQALDFSKWVLLFGLAMIKLILIEAIKRYFIVKENNNKNKMPLQIP